MAEVAYLASMRPAFKTPVPPKRRGGDPWADMFGKHKLCYSLLEIHDALDHVKAQSSSAANNPLEFCLAQCFPNFSPQTSTLDIYSLTHASFAWCCSFMGHTGDLWAGDWMLYSLGSRRKSHPEHVWKPVTGTNPVGDVCSSNTAAAGQEKDRQQRSRPGTWLLLVQLWFLHQAAMQSTEAIYVYGFPLVSAGARIQDPPWVTKTQIRY